MLKREMQILDFYEIITINSQTFECVSAFADFDCMVNTFLSTEGSVHS